MTIDLLFATIVLLVILIGLDIFLLRARQFMNDAQVQPGDIFDQILHRARERFEDLKLHLPQKRLAELPAVNLPAVVEGENPAESGIPAPLPSPVQQDVYETRSNLEPVPENETQAAESLVRVHITAEIPTDSVVHITIQTVNGESRAAIRQETIGLETLHQGTLIPATVEIRPAAIQDTVRRPGQFWFTLRQWFSTRVGALKSGTPDWERILFVAAALIYLLVVSIGIDRFPIYFFTDEAVHANLAAEFVTRGFTGSDGSFFPTYFSLGPSFGLNGVSVYLQVIPFMLFGKSVVVTRMVSALITLAAAILVGLLLKQIFKIKSYWLGILLLITSPTWFLHARTAFEYMEVASFFAATLYFYNRYRQGEDKYLYATIISAALTFYTHGLGQVLAGLTALLLFVSDFRYHFQPERRRTLLIGLGLAVLLFLPYVRYNISNSTAITAQISQRGSYWMNDNFTLQDKVLNLLKEYARGINPFFWFLPNSIDISRHEMKGYGNILFILLPFALMGIARAVIKFRQSEYRSVLIALLVAPIPATIVAVGTPRLLWMIIPWVILIAIGLDWATEWITSRKQHIRFEYVNLGLFIVLALISVYTLRDALVKGPTWYTDYGLYGMQYGAKQVFQDTVIPELEKDPKINFIISPSWANGTDQFDAFFMPKELSNRVRFGSPGDLVKTPSQLTPSTIFILTSDEFANLSKDLRFKDIQVRETIPYPNGKPGFYLLTLKFVDNIEQIIAAEHVADREPVEDKVTINGQVIRILHSPIGGNINDTFDDNPDTLTKVIEANPYIFDLYPDPPLDTNSITVQTGSLSNFTVTVSLYAPGATVPVTYAQVFTNLPPDPLVTMNFDEGPVKSARIYIEIRDNTSGDTSQLHVRTIQFK